MEAKFKRRLRPGTEYNRYFKASAPDYKDAIISKSDSVFTTISEMGKIVKSTLVDTREIAKVLNGATIDKTCQNIYDFVYNHIQYTLDKPGVEQLRRPVRTWADRSKGVDCDCYSIFISSILTNLGITHYFRMTKYTGDWQHIYVVVPKEPGADVGLRRNYNVIDCVVDQYDYEVPYSDKHDKKMIQYLSGVPNVGTPGTQVYRLGILPKTFGAEFIGFGEKSLNGLGSVDTTTDLAVDFLNRLKLHLQNTRDGLKALVAIDPSQQREINRLDQVLTVWHDGAQRDALLDKFAAEENALSGLGALGGFWDSVKSTVKKVGNAVGNAAKAVGTGIKNAGQWVGDKAGDAWDGIKNAAEWTYEFVMKYNPLSVLIRNGFLLAAKINLFRMSEKLGYGYWTEAEAKSKGLNLTEFKKVQEKLNDVRRLWRGLQGDEDTLKKNILQGWNHGVSKRGGIKGFEEDLAGLGEPATAAGTAAASTVIATVLAWLSKVDWQALMRNFQGQKPDQEFYQNQQMPEGYQLPPYDPTQPQDGGNGGGSSDDNTTMYLMLGGVLLVAVLLSKPTK